MHLIWEYFLGIGFSLIGLSVSLGLDLFEVIAIGVASQFSVLRLTGISGLNYESANDEQRAYVMRNTTQYVAKSKPMSKNGTVLYVDVKLRDPDALDDNAKHVAFWM